MMLPRRTALAIAAVLDVARLARGAPLSAKMLAGRYRLPPRQFESLLQDLTRAHVLKSLRGPKGGYELARERRRISIGDIVRALAPEPPPGRSEAYDLLFGAIGPALAQAEKAYLTHLDTVSIEDALGQEAEAAATVADFTI